MAAEQSAKINGNFVFPEKFDYKKSISEIFYLDFIFICLVSGAIIIISTLFYVTHIIRYDEIADVRAHDRFLSGRQVLSIFINGKFKVLLDTNYFRVYDFCAGDAIRIIREVILIYLHKNYDEKTRNPQEKWRFVHSWKQIKFIKKIKFPKEKKILRIQDLLNFLWIKSSRKSLIEEGA